MEFRVVVLAVGCLTSGAGLSSWGGWQFHLLLVSRPNKTRYHATNETHTLCMML